MELGIVRGIVQWGGVYPEDEDELKALHSPFHPFKVAACKEVQVEAAVTSLEGSPVDGFEESLSHH